MGDIAIKLEDIGKKYRIGQLKSRSFYESFEYLTRSRKKSSKEIKSSSKQSENHDHSNEFWALRDISFEVKKGEAVGIIGRNGTGKSTLLKILSRITKPTTGKFWIDGRVSSLLEVGTGFHNELSGRENIFLNGTILGMKRNEIKEKYDEIVDFSGVEDFLDTAVKHYSSGMKVRLAFSVAAHLDPEILIIDEVLAVGDAEFQKKCLGKMEDVTGEGRTVCFVSHNMEAVEKLCDNGIMLQNGQTFYKDSNITSVVDKYLNSYSVSERGFTIWEATEDNPFSNEIHSFSKFGLVDEIEQPFENIINTNREIRIIIEGYLYNADPSLNIGYALYNETNKMIYWSWAKDHPDSGLALNTSGYFKLSSKIPGGFLSHGRYKIEVFSVLHKIKELIKPGHGVSLSFEIEGGFKNTIIHPNFVWNSI